MNKKNRVTNCTCNIKVFILTTGNVPLHIIMPHNSQ